MGMGSTEPGADKSKAIPEDSVHLDHCMELLTVWHQCRTSLEDKLYDLTGDETIRSGRSGKHMKEVFQGHCTGNGAENYISIKGTPETMLRLPEIYE